MKFFIVIALTVINMPFLLISMEESKHKYDGGFYIERQNNVAINIIDKLGLVEKKFGDVLVLDCDIGGIAAYIAQIMPEAEVVGVDPSEEVIDIARKYHRHLRKNLLFKVADVRKELPFEEHFNLVFSAEALLWTTESDKEKIINNLYKCLKPGGRILFKTLNDFEEDHPITGVLKNLAACQEWQSALSKYTTTLYKYLLAPDEVTTLFPKEKWRTVRAADDTTVDIFHTEKGFCCWMLDLIKRTPAFAHLEEETKEKLSDAIVKEYVKLENVKTEEGFILYRLPTIFVTAHKRNK